MKLLFIPFDMMGHINSGIGLAITLRDRGHSIHFAVDSDRQNVVNGYGFQVHPIVYNKPYDFETVMYKKFAHTFKRQYLRQIKEGFSCQVIRLFVDFYNMIIFKNFRVKELLEDINPDVIIADELYAYPSLVYSGKPWVLFHSPNPRLFYQDHNLPCPTFGCK